MDLAKAISTAKRAARVDQEWKLVVYVDLEQGFLPVDADDTGDNLVYFEVSPGGELVVGH